MSELKIKTTEHATVARFEDNGKPVEQCGHYASFSEEEANTLWRSQQQE